MITFLHLQHGAVKAYNLLNTFSLVNMAITETVNTPKKLG